jgi:hypothetical protein
MRTRQAPTKFTSQNLIPIKHRRSGQAEMPEQFDQCGKALLAIGIEVEAGIVKEAGTGAHADAAVLHVA